MKEYNLKSITDINKITRRAYITARKVGLDHETSKDFSQTLLLNLVLKKVDKTIIYFDRRLIDFIRKETGRKSATKSRHSLKSKYFQEIYRELKEKQRITVEPGPSLVDEYRAHIKEADLLFYDLYFQADFNLEDIAEYYGVTTGRMSQKLSIMIKRLKKAIKKTL
jgi:hypothetical protein